MRQKRAKTYRRLMALYTQTFNFRPPFQILVTNDLILATNIEYDLLKLLTSCVQGEVKPMMTQCCVEALYKLGRSYQPSVDLAKTFERRRCNHREAVAPDECVKDVIGPTNKHRYILASQSPSLRQTLQSVPGLPIIHFNPRGVLVLSPPSRATLKHKDELEKERRMGGGKVEVVDDGGNVVGEATSGGSGAGKRGRVKGPNPMSVRKKKAVVQGGEKAGQEGAGKRKKRGRDGQDDAAVEGGKEGEREGGDDTGKRNRKRKRRGTGGVTQATAEPGEVATISERE